jgi:hypothetical protein
MVVQNKRFVRGSAVDVDEEPTPGSYSEAIDFRVASRRFPSMLQASAKLGSYEILIGTQQ